MRTGCPPETGAMYQAAPPTHTPELKSDRFGSGVKSEPAYRRRLASGDQMGLELERSPVRNSVRSPPSAGIRNTAVVRALGRLYQEA